MTSPLDPRDDDRLSGYVDGALSPDETVEVERLVEHSAAHREVVDELRAVKELLGGLPPVERAGNATGVVVPIGRRRRGAVWAAAAGVAAAAAVLVAVLLVGGGGPAGVDPPVEMLALRHLDGGTEDFAPMEPDEVGGAMPDDIGHGMAREGIFQRDDIVQLRYSDGVHAVSVFRQHGKVMWKMLPAGDMVSMAGHQAWHGVVDGVDVVVVDAEGEVLTLVADPGMGELLTDDLVGMLA